VSISTTCRKSALNLSISSLALVAFFTSAHLAYANPVGGQVVGGTATITGEGSDHVTIDQSSDRVIINWDEFNIDRNEITTFLQSSSDAVALNRVTGSNDPSQILGNLIANGNVVLVNPNGVVFGRDARVDVNGLIASTADVSNSDFMSGNLNFANAGNPNAEIANLGSISAAEGGLVALVAPNVRNDGMIVADMGKVVLGGGEAFSLDLYGDNLINFTYSEGEGPTYISVNNNGTIQSDGGQIILSAEGARHTVDSVINIDGLIQAQTINQQTGDVRVLGGELGQVTTNDIIDASGLNSGQHGGRVIITGENVDLNGNAHINVDGHAGGGHILIGGDYLGGNGNQDDLPHENARNEDLSIRNANTVSLADGAVLSASAVHSGDGGKVILWSDNNTDFFGDIQANGGSFSGDGGFVETSSAGRLIVDGLTSVSSNIGVSGTWLLDPNHVIVEDVIGSTSVSEVGSDASENNTSRISTASIINALNAGGTVDIDIGGASSLNPGFNILIAGDLIKTSSNDSRLIIDASQDIIIDGAIVSENGILNVLFFALTGSIYKADDALFDTAGGEIQFNFRDNLNFRNFNRSGDITFALSQRGAGIIEFSAFLDLLLSDGTTRREITDQFFAEHGEVFNGQDALVLRSGFQNGVLDSSSVGLVMSEGVRTTLFSDKNIVFSDYSVTFSGFVLGDDSGSEFSFGTFGENVGYGSQDAFNGIPEWFGFGSANVGESVAVEGLDAAIEVGLNGRIRRFFIARPGETPQPPEDVIFNTPPTANFDRIFGPDALLGSEYNYTTPVGLFSDDQGEGNLTLSIPDLPNGFSFVNNGDGTLTIVGNPNTVGEFLVEIIATDEEGESVSTTLSWRVTTNSSTLGGVNDIVGDGRAPGVTDGLETTSITNPEDAIPTTLVFDLWSNSSIEIPIYTTPEDLLQNLELFYRDGILISEYWYRQPESIRNQATALSRFGFYLRNDGTPSYCPVGVNCEAGEFKGTPFEYLLAGRALFSAARVLVKETGNKTAEFILRKRIEFLWNKGVPKPDVQDVQSQKLRNIIFKDLYKSENTVGKNRSLQDAIRQELLTGEPIKNVYHAKNRGPQAIRSLKNFINNPKNAKFTSDLKLAKKLLKDLEDALAGK